MTTTAHQARHRRARRINGWLLLAGLALLVLAVELWLAWGTGEFTRGDMVALGLGGLGGNLTAAAFIAHTVNF